MFLLSEKQLGWFMVLNATFNNISVISWWQVIRQQHWKVLSNNQLLDSKGTTIYLEGGGLWFFVLIRIFFFKQLDTFLFFFNCNQTKLFFFLPSQNRIFFSHALYKGVSQYSFLDAMHNCIYHIAHIYYKFM